MLDASNPLVNTAAIYGGATLLSELIAQMAGGRGGQPQGAGGLAGTMVPSVAGRREDERQQPQQSGAADFVKTAGTVGSMGYLLYNLLNR